MLMYPAVKYVVALLQPAFIFFVFRPAGLTLRAGLNAG